MRYPPRTTTLPLPTGGGGVRRPPSVAPQLFFVVDASIKSWGYPRPPPSLSDRKGSHNTPLPLSPPPPSPYLPFRQTLAAPAGDFSLEDFNTVAQPRKALRDFVATSMKDTGKAQHRPLFLFPICAQ